MAADRSFIEKNRAELARLKALLGRLSDADLARSVGGGWTVSAALAHLAFWDQRALVLLERWEKEGYQDSPYDSPAINDASLPFWLAIPPRSVLKLTLESAEAVDRKVEAVPPELIAQIIAGGLPINPVRGEHRSEHIEQIEEALGR
jgi:hypothetical protein